MVSLTPSIKNHRNLTKDFFPALQYCPKNRGSELVCHIKKSFQQKKKSFRELGLVSVCAQQKMWILKLERRNKINWIISGQTA